MNTFFYLEHLVADLCTYIQAHPHATISHVLTEVRGLLGSAMIGWQVGDVGHGIGIFVCVCICLCIFFKGLP